MKDPLELYLMLASTIMTIVIFLIIFIFIIPHTQNTQIKKAGINFTVCSNSEIKITSPYDNNRYILWRGGFEPEIKNGGCLNVSMVESPGTSSPIIVGEWEYILPLYFEGLLNQK